MHVLLTDDISSVCRLAAVALASSRSTVICDQLAALLIEHADDRLGADIAYGIMHAGETRLSEALMAADRSGALSAIYRPSWLEVIPWGSDILVDYLDVVASSDADPAARAAAFRALAGCRREWAESTAATHLSDSHPRMRGMSAILVSGIDKRRAHLQTIADMAEEEDPFVIQCALIALNRYALSDKEADTRQERHVSVLKNDDWRVRRLAAYFIDPTRDEIAIDSLLDRLQTDDHAEVRLQAAAKLAQSRSSCGKHLERRVDAALASRYASETDPRVHELLRTILDPSPGNLGAVSCGISVCVSTDPFREVALMPEWEEIPPAPSALQ
jgi:hypothetical protein